MLDRARNSTPHAWLKRAFSDVNAILFRPDNLSRNSGRENKTGAIEAKISPIGIAGVDNGDK